MDFQDGKRVLGDIKSKLGFGSKSQDQEYDEYYDDEFDDYADDYDGYDDYDDGYETASAPRSSRYDSYSSAGSRSSRTSSSSARGGSSLPRLVSIDDVRANTQVPSSLNRDPLPPRHVTSAAASTSSFRGGRTMVDSSLPPQMTPEGTAATAAAASRRRSSEGLESLFTPTTEDASRERADMVSPSAPQVTTRSAYDPYESYTGSSVASYSATRSISVLKPSSYADVERVSKSLKAGDAVVLCLANVAESLAKRVLDFSFGVASALDASVECIGDKTFAVTRDGGLSEAERASLRGQGVL